MPRVVKAKTNELQTGFLQELYGTLCGKLEGYTLNPNLFEARKDIITFVRGLRFSSLLIYQIRKITNNTDLTASWGLIHDEDSDARSTECDIIVHKNGCVHAWNGDDDVGGSVMDFRFISKEDALLVISCKQVINSITKAIKKDAVNLADFIPRIWLFAEHCPKRKVEQLREQAKAAGYERFWFLYSFEKGEIGNERNDPGWLKFAEELRQLAD